MNCKKNTLTNIGQSIISFNYQRCSDALWQYNVKLYPGEVKNIWYYDNTFQVPDYFSTDLTVQQETFPPCDPTLFGNCFQYLIVNFSAETGPISVVACTNDGPLVREIPPQSSSSYPATVVLDFLGEDWCISGDTAVEIEKTSITSFSYSGNCCETITPTPTPTPTPTATQSACFTTINFDMTDCSDTIYWTDCCGTTGTTVLVSGTTGYSPPSGCLQYGSVIGPLTNVTYDVPCDCVTPTPTSTQTSTPTPTPNETCSPTPTITSTPTETEQPLTPTPTPTPTETEQPPTPTPTPTPTETEQPPTPTPTPTISETPTETPTNTPTPTETEVLPTPTPTPTCEPTLTPSPSCSPTYTPTPTCEPTLTPTPTCSPTKTCTPTPTETPTPTVTPTVNYYYYSALICGSPSGLYYFRSTDPLLTDHAGSIYGYCDEAPHTACGGTPQCFDNISPASGTPNTNDILLTFDNCAECEAGLPSPTPTTSESPTPTPTQTETISTGYFFNLIALPYSFPSDGNAIMNNNPLTFGSTEINLLDTASRGFYFSSLDYDSVDTIPYFSSFTGQSITMTFTQGGDSAIYSGDTDSFKFWSGNTGELPGTPGTGFVFGTGIGVPPLGTPSGNAVLIQSATTTWVTGDTVFVSAQISP